MSTETPNLKLPRPVGSDIHSLEAQQKLIDRLDEVVAPKSSVPPALSKATTAQAQAGTDDSAYMTPAKTAHAVSILSPSPSVVTAVKDGLMPATDKVKLDGIAVGAQKNPTAVTTQTDGLMVYNDKIKLDGIEVGAQKNPILVTTATDGLMPATDKVKLDGIAVGAQKNPPAVTTRADGLMSASDKIKLDNGITLGDVDARIKPVSDLANSLNNEIGYIAEKADAAATKKDLNALKSVATVTENGLMPATDKVKLNSVETGAQKNPGLATSLKDGLMSSNDKGIILALKKILPKTGFLTASTSGSLSISIHSHIMYYSRAYSGGLLSSSRTATLGDIMYLSANASTDKGSLHALDSSFGKGVATVVGSQSNTTVSGYNEKHETLFFIRLQPNNVVDIRAGDDIKSVRLTIANAPNKDTFLHAEESGVSDAYHYFINNAVPYSNVSTRLGSVTTVNIEYTSEHIMLITFGGVLPKAFTWNFDGAMYIKVGTNLIDKPEMYLGYRG